MRNVILVMFTFVVPTLLVTTVTFGATSSSATFLATGTFPPVQFPPQDVAVFGLRISPGMARHDFVFGLDIGGIGNIVEKGFFGVAVSGLFHYTKATTIALAQISGLTNVNTGDAYITGLQFATLANIGKNQHTTGLQVGLYNQSKAVYGMQVGLINKAENLYGFQVGLVNIVTNGYIKFFPIINVGFK